MKFDDLDPKIKPSSMRKLLVGFILFLCVVWCSEYTEHFELQRDYKSAIEIDSGDFTSSGNIITFPRKNGEDFLISAIDSAQKRIWIEIYTFTKMQNIYDALLRAKSRGVDVRILLEWNVYSQPYINTKTFKFLKKNGIAVKYTDNNNYNFTHAKFWIIDDVYFISTGNWTKSFFSKNREYVYSDSDSTTRNFLERIFLLDSDWEWFYQKSQIPPHIVISPLNSRQKIEDFITHTNDEIFLYVQTISDESIINKISQIKASGKKVFVCTADNEASRKASESLKDIWYFAKKPYLHAKILLKDNAKIFLWSQNFTTNSLENNREVWILLQDRKDIFENLKKDILNHCVK